MNDVRQLLGDRCAELEPLLVRMNFIETPGSIGHHGAYRGGLLDHSVAVGLELVRYTEKLGLTWMNTWSPGVVGVLHDLCKVYTYVEVNGVYQKRTDSMLVGHGALTLQLLQMNNVTLTPEEVLCIRYHMGAYEVDDWNATNYAIAEFQNVLFTHNADMYAAKVRGI